MDLTARDLGIDAARAVDPARYAIGGRAPAHAVRPASREEVSEVLRIASRDRLAVLPWGGGVELAGAAAPQRYDIAIDLGALDRVIEYDPEDLTLTAECGVTLASLARAVAARGQELPLEAPDPARATLGGVLAANASGPRRRSLGSPRDRILGARFALGDGTLARTGGKVVKNVAGHAVHRMLCGSRGTLAILLEASLKLLPAPARRRALVFALPGWAVADTERWMTIPRIEPAWLTVLGRAHRRLFSSVPASDAYAIIGLEEDEAWVDRQTAIVREALGAPAATLDGDDAIALRARVTDLPAALGPSRLRFASAHVSPAALAPFASEPWMESAVFHAPSGGLWIATGPEDGESVVTALDRHGFALIEASPAGVARPAVPPAAAIDALRGRIRAALDPHGVFVASMP